jgi:lipopolysaccharide transport system permease protein
MIGNVLKGITLIASHRKLFCKLCMSSIRGTYASSAFGMLWLFLGPLIFFSFYTLIYTLIFPFKPTDMAQMQYVLHVFCGISIFLAFSSSLSVGCTSIISNKNVLQNTVLPAQLIPIKSIIIPIITFLFSLSLVFLFYIIRYQYTWYILLTIPVIISFIMMLIGLVWVVSLLTILFRDIQQIIGYAMMFLLVLSPIAYSPSMLPKHLKLVIYLNPLSYYIIPLQDIIVQGRSPSVIVLLMSGAFGLLLFGFGYKTFEVAKKIVFDYV